MNQVSKQEILEPNYELVGRLHSIESMGAVDGPGIRTIFFLQGCPLRCAYCHNPDSQPKIGAGKTITVQEVVDLAKRYKAYYKNIGGITFSGGEPLMQGEFIYHCCLALAKEGINVCLDTSGYGDPRWYSKVLPLASTLLLDIKQFQDPEFKVMVGAPMHTFMRFLKRLTTDYGFKGKIWIRHVMVPTITDDRASMRKLVQLILPYHKYIEKIEILPYHILGVSKYEDLGRDYLLKGIPAMDKDKAKKLEKYVRRHFTDQIRKMS